MGWSGYGIYDGDGTATYQMWLVEESVKPHKVEEIMDCFEERGQKHILINKNIKTKFIKNIEKAIKIIGRPPAYWNEDKAIEWQMFLALLIDNKINVPQKVYDHGIDATKFLIWQEEKEKNFDKPSLRIKELKKFIKYVNAYVKTNKKTSS